MIRNTTQQTTLVLHCVFAHSLLSQALGLMFRKKLIDTGWVFTFKWASSWDITNLFVFQDIDVLWLDKDKRVTKKKTVRAWTVRVVGSPHTRYVLELPPHAAKNVRIGDYIDWSSSTNFKG